MVRTGCVMVRMGCVKVCKGCVMVRTGSVMVPDRVLLTIPNIDGLPACMYTYYIVYSSINGE